MALTRKTCAACQEEKDLSAFHKRGQGFHSYCKACRRAKLDPEVERARKRAWYDGHRESAIECARQSARAHPEAVSATKRAWYERNANSIKTTASTPEAKQARRIRVQAWRQKNKHVVAWRGLLRGALKRLGQRKKTRTLSMLGYSAKALKAHIEALWTPGMSWENHGEWHIDHIKSVASFAKETDVMVVNALSNLRPLWATSREVDGIRYEGNLNRTKPRHDP